MSAESLPPPVAAAGTAARLRATSAIAASSAVLIIAGVTRGRVMAAVAGPEGFGLAGILQSALVAASTLGAFGLSVTGVRLVAAARAGGPEKVAAARRTTLTLAVAGGVAAAFTLLVVGRHVGMLLAGRPVGTAALAIIACGVVAQTVSQAQSAWLTGHQRIAALASSSIWGAVIGAALAVAALLAAGPHGIPLAVIAPVVAELGALTWFARRAIAATPGQGANAIGAGARAVLELGAAVTAAGAITTLGQLAARGILRAESGLAGVGNFQVAWTISMSYLGIVFSAMAVDYYPRLALAADAPAAGREINAQTRFALRLAAPLILGTMAAAPLVVRWLFADGFHDAPAILRWQLLGDVFKIPGWAVGFLLLARGAGARFLIAETCWTVVYLLVLAWGVGAWGPVAAGIAFCCAGAVYLLIAQQMVAGLVGFAWEGGTRRLFALVLAAALSSLVLAHAGRPGAVLQAVLAVGAAGLWWRAFPELLRRSVAAPPAAGTA